MYKLLRPFLFALDSETIHNAAIKAGEMVTRVGLADILGKLYAYEDARLRTRAFGIDFSNPVGLAAGFDKDARLINMLPALGFGFIEIGTVTARPQAGNPRPRLFRITKDGAILNRMGFNGEGAKAMRKRLSALKKKIPVGVNIGKNKDVPNEHAIENYSESFSAIVSCADYITVNVSSPNTPGLRALQDKEPLLALLAHLKNLNGKLGAPKPILLKIAPDLTNDALDDIVEIVERTKLDGIIATNTTVSREGLRTDLRAVAALGAGGVSGKPLHKHSVAIVKYLYRRTEGKVPIVGVGGIFTAEDAYEMICAGASLVQIYTGMIYEGPGLVKRIKRGLVELLKRDGFSNIAQAIGSKSNYCPSLSRADGSDKPLDSVPTESVGTSLGG
ncbi:MAG: dihydroorotate dehydrogenase (quinone) [Candidatus Liptonbacteria bacterium RIFCSPLOWO2_01_FULL_53_13]|uniref:Dihydroorotate dehydrogenase (quinone) n=1 Tax=Candidatus Liptonbacteria bacterium RIFCSPLOWO2_01_FULL_53_13 TaxID=1798651 RepID=A0A1G2CMR3_9BACT|nr:MAG: dihydroorotate dehydrogenase (quinone) [Candidatus Liptonbacteria bacterium RIFCSPLOWO2_01_FULL_53_13]